SDKINRIMDGRLAAFVLDEIADNDEDDETPVGVLNILNVDHIVQIDTFTAQELVENGMLKATNYTEAFKSIDIDEQFADELTARRVAEDAVYQVTPNGNTLVLLIPDFGPSSKKQKEVPSLVPQLAPIPVIRRS